MKNDIINNLYLNQVEEINLHRKKLNPIRQKNISLSPTNHLSASKSVSDIFKNLNGSVIIQNWNTKKNIPKNIGELINLPSLIDLKKVNNNNKNNSIRLDKPSDKLSLFDKIKLSNNLENFKRNEKLNNLKIDTLFEGNLSPRNSINKINYTNKSIIFNRKLRRSSSTISSNKINEDNNNSLVPYGESNRNNEKETETNSKQQTISNNNISNSNFNLNSLVRIKSPRVFKFRKLKLAKKNEPIDFSTFKEYLFLRDNDFLYARRVGGPVDFALCSFSDINPNKEKNNLISDFHRDLTSGINRKSNYIEYITISKNTILHYLKGTPKLYSIKEWTENYIKFKKLLKIPLFKNFKNAGLFGLWKRYYRKKKRVLYTEKLKKRTYFIDRNLITGLLEIRRILKDMTFFELFRLKISQPIYLNSFSQLYFDGLEYNNRRMEEFRSKIKKQLSRACSSSYKAFRKAKNISLDDTNEDDNPMKDDEENKELDLKERILNRNNRKQREKDIHRNLEIFLKDAIPYAQDATRKKHFKKLLKFIRLIDFLYNYSKFDLIIKSLSLLEKRFSRLYEAYENKYADNPLIITTIVTLGNKISYNPSIELITSAIFDHFISENIDLVIRIKNFIDPQEFPTYMVCYEEVFEVSVDQNGILSGRIKEDDQYNDLFDNIKNSFDKCRRALDEKAASLVPILLKNNKFMKTNFTKLEEKADHKQLKEYIDEFKKMEESVRKLEKKVNIGIFEFQLDLLLDQVLPSPQYLLSKIYVTIPKILIKRINDLIEKTDKYNELLDINVGKGDVEAFIKLKKEVEECSNKRPDVEKEMEEINELNLIVNNHFKEMKLEDFERRRFDHLLNSRTNFERKLDSMIYFIEQNIKVYRAELMVKIRKYDEMLKKIYEDLNDDIVNKFNFDTSVPLLFLQEKYFLIAKATENKKVFQQQEVDIEMNEIDRSNFENLDLVTYEHDLKKTIWENIYEYQGIIITWEKIQIMDIKTDIMADKIYNWKSSCLIGIKDLKGCKAAEDFLFSLKIYEQVLDILKIVQNENIQKNEFLRDSLKKIMNLTNMEFTDPAFLFEKLLNMKGLYDAIPKMQEINLRANEENRLIKLHKEKTQTIFSHYIPLTLKVDTEKGYSKYIITNEDLIKEEEFIEQNISTLNKEMLNPYISIVLNDFQILINKIYKYQNFLYLFYDYECYILRLDNIIYNADFIKEYPSDFKKLSSENMTKSLMKLLKDSLNLGKYLESAHERAMNNLRSIINSYELNYKGIHNFLNKRRKEIQDYYLLNDRDLIQLVENRDSYEVKQKLILKIYPFIKYMLPGKENDDHFRIITKYNKEEISLRYIKGMKNFNDAMESIEAGLTKKIKDNFKQFKRNFDASLKPKSKKNPKDIINDFLNIDNDNNKLIYQTIFICIYHVFYYFLEKTLEKENEAFDKLFDFYSTIKDDWKKKYIKILREDNNPVLNIQLIISAMALWDYFIKNVENLLRDDVLKTSDYTYNKILQIKVENDSVNIKLFNFSFEYGNDYVGLFYDFFVLPQTEKTFLSIINVLHNQNPFIIYSNQSFFKKELIEIVSNILGRRINYIAINENFDIKGINNLIYGNMRVGQYIAFTNTECVDLNIFKCLADRIIEISHLLKSRQEEGLFIDRDSEKYLINAKRFNMFMCYDIDNIQLYNKNFYIPENIKYSFRCIGMNYINENEYLKIALSAYGIQKSEEITNKIIFILDLLMGKNKYLNKNNLKRIIYQFFIENILNKLIEKRNEINSSSVYNIAKECLKELVIPFIQTEEDVLKDFECLLNIILFDYKQIERENDLKKRKSNQIPPLSSDEQKSNKNEMIQIRNDKLFDKFCDEILSSFSFDNDEYKKKIRLFYNSLNYYQSFTLLGPALSGKTNLFVSMRDISIKLNAINNSNFPIFNYIKYFPNHKTNSELFSKNNIKYSYQVNNIYFKSICDILRRSGKTLDDLHERYKKMQFELYYNIYTKKIFANKTSIDLDSIRNSKKEKEKENENENENALENENNDNNENSNKKEIIKDEMMKDIEPINENEEFENKEKDNENNNENNEKDKNENIIEENDGENNQHENNKQNEFGEEVSQFIEEEEEEEDEDEEENMTKEKNDEEINNTQSNNKLKEIKKSQLKKKQNISKIIKKYKAIIFDGSVSPYWYEYLVNFINPFNLYPLPEGDFLSLAKNKFIYETSSISRVSPSFITKQNIICLSQTSFHWLNISYAYVEKNYKTSKNEELKNYIKGLFENYGGNIIDFVEVNKLKCMELCINPNYTIKNLINLFNAILPEFDFVEITIGRTKSADYIPKIELIKKQTLSIFIFSCSWIMNLLTNFLIRNKIEKAVSDLFKSDDLKGPIFDYYIGYNKYTEDYNYTLWNELQKNEIYQNPKIEKEPIYYYGHDFITTLENLSYQYIISQLLLAQTPILLVGRPCSGKSFLINRCIDNLIEEKEVKSILINCTHRTNSTELEKRIIKHMDIISRKVLGDKLLRKNVVFIDDIHLCEKNNQINEYMRYLLNIKGVHEPKHNTFKFLRNFNIIISGNVYNNVPIRKFNNNDNILKSDEHEYDYEEYTNNYEDFIRYSNRFSLVCLNLFQNNYINMFKAVFESYLRNYNTNTSNILANAYTSTLIKLNELLAKEISPTFRNLHYYFNNRDIIQILQRFNMYKFRDARDFTDNVKKIFLYESYSTYTNKFITTSEIEIFKNNLVKAYNIYFKQDKIDISIFDEFDKDNNYIFCKNFIDVYKENPEGTYIPPRDLEYVYIEKKIDIKKFLIPKIKAFYTDYYNYGGGRNTEEASYIINEYNNQMLDNLIRILNLLNNENPNLILIGPDHTGKELLAKIALYIMKYKYIDININKLLSKGKHAFEKDNIVKIVNDAIYNINNNKMFIFFQNDLFNNINSDDNLFIFEIISLLLNPDNYMNKYNIFINENTKNQNINIYKDNTDNNLIDIKNPEEINTFQKKENEIKEKIKSNINIILPINETKENYRQLFLDYSSILNNCYTIYIKEYNDESLNIISNHVFEKIKSENDKEFTMTNTLSKTLLDIFNFVKSIYEEYTLKINLRITLNQRHYMNVCQFITNNYQKYKNILIKNKTNYEKINNNLKRAEELLNEKLLLIEKMRPQKEHNEKSIEECLKIISNKNVEKNKIKSKKVAEEKLLNNELNIRAEKMNKLDIIFIDIKETIKKITVSLHKLNDRDLVDIKNSWDNFPAGKFILQKMLELIDIHQNANNNINYDFDYIKKNFGAKHLKRLSNIDYTKENQQFIDLIKSVVNNQEFSLNEKFNKPYKLANLFCDYFNKVYKYYILCDENADLINKIKEIDNKINGHKQVISNYLNVYNEIEKDILELNAKISNFETARNNMQLLMDKIKSLTICYKTFIDISNKKVEIFKKKEKKNLYLLKYFDFYMIYIAIYIHFAPILNRHYRDKLKMHLLQCLENMNCFGDNNNDEENDDKQIDFIELIYNFMDITGNEKELYMNSSSFSDFLKENFIFMHLFSDKVPLIIDFTQFGKNIINEFAQFEKQHDYLVISFNNYSNSISTNANIPDSTIGLKPDQMPKNEFKEKLEKSAKLGWNLFIDNINDINKIYYIFYDFIHKRYIGDKTKRNVLIDEHMYTIGETFKLFLFKNTYGSSNMQNINNNKNNKSSLIISDNLWFNLLFINFNLSNNDIKERIFNSISSSRNQEAFNSLKKTKINMVKRIITKTDTEQKMVKSILEVDLSGNEEKLNEVKYFNDKYNSEYQLHCDCEEMIISLDKRYENQKTGLIDNYDKISNDCARIFKWLYKFYLFEVSYKIDSKSFIHYILEYFDEKFSINNEINIMNKKESNQNLNLISGTIKKISNENIINKKRIIEEDEDYEINVTESEDEESHSDYNYGNKKAGIDKIENIVPIKKEKYIYKNEKDSKSLIIFIYNKIKNIFGKKDIKLSLLLIFGFICVNLQKRIPLPFKGIFNNCYLFNNSFEDYFDETDIKKSPLENISDRQWSILDKLNIISGDLLGNILKNISRNKDRWNFYLSDKYKDFNNYFFNNCKFPDEELEDKTDSLIKFIFFYTVKPEKHEFIIELFLGKILLDETNKMNNINYNYYLNNERYNSLYVKNNFEDYDIIKAFKNFKPQKDHALVLIAPHDNINLYDKILYEYCYLKMFANNPNTNNQENANKTHFGEKTLSNNLNSTNQNINQINNKNNPINNLENINNMNNNIEGAIIPDKRNISRAVSINTIKGEQSALNVTVSGFGGSAQYLGDIKYKEIILDNNNYYDLNQNDFEYIKNSIKSGNVIIIKNAHFLMNQFNEVLKEINDMRPEDISIGFRLILICDINEVMKNKSIYEQCRIINDNLLYEDKNMIFNKYLTVKERIMNLIYKIPVEVYLIIINSQNYFMRLFLRKLIYYYISIFGLLQSIQLNNPFIITINDFYYLCQYIISFLEQENFTEEKYNEFINLENPSGNNFISFINILDNIFIFSRQILKEDESKLHKFISELFNFKIFMDPDFYLEIGSIKISVTSKDSSSTLNYDLTCEDIYKSFDIFSIEDYELILPNSSLSEINTKKYYNSNKIIKNLITAINMNYYNEEKNIEIDNLDLNKIYKHLIDLQENIPLSVVYQISEYTIGLDSVDEVNPSMFKKNKYGLFFNSLDNTIYNEVRLFNKKLELFHIQINLLKSMITGERIYSNLFYNNFKLLNNDIIPFDFNILNMNENIDKDYNDDEDNENNWSFDTFKKIINYRIHLFKTWLKDGFLKCYHLPLFYNIQLFINDLKIHFSKKYYGENDYSKITPEMICLKFFSTTYSTYDELVSSDDKNLNYYNKLYNNEVIWVNGLILQNAELDKDYCQYLSANKKNKKTNIKMNIVGITYSVYKYELDEYDEDYDEKNNNEDDNTNGNESESNVTESKYSETNGEKEVKNTEKDEVTRRNERRDTFRKSQKIVLEDTKKVKVYIYEKKNGCKYHKYYKENSIGFMEFYVNSDKIDQNYIFEHDIRIIIDEYGDFEDQRKDNINQNN